MTHIYYISTTQTDDANESLAVVCGCGYIREKPCAIVPHLVMIIHNIVPLTVIWNGL